MKTKIKYFLPVFAIVTGLYFCSCHTDLALPEYKTRNVIVLVIDGPRYSETWGDSSHQYIPHFSGLAGQGTVFTNFYNDGITNTMSGHGALTTGFYENLNNGGFENPMYASFMQYWSEKYHAEEKACWLIASKDKLEALRNCKDVYYKNNKMPSVDCGNSGLGSGYRNDSLTFSKVMSTLKTYHPRLMLINFKEPDASGHAANWNGYLQGIMNTDRYLGDLWNFLQTDPFYANSTTLFVTNDHGRHLDGWQDGFVSHGDTCMGCRHINLLALGPDFKTGHVETGRYDQTDIPVTIAELFGFDMPHAQGDVMSTIFK
ncbi:MAG: alkaline phosphatase family protein [Bacteroidota bacterium]